jgi:hypothetical protein
LQLKENSKKAFLQTCHSSNLEKFTNSSWGLISRSLEAHLSVIIDGLELREPEPAGRNALGQILEKC